MNNTPKRGRPVKALSLPTSSRMTVDDIWALNPHIECRLSIYTKVGKLVKDRVLRKTGDVVRDGGVGKPSEVYQTMASFRRSRGLKRAAKLRKLANAAPVDLTSSTAVAA